MAGQEDISKQDPIAIAKQAERDLNSHEAKAGHDGLDRSGRHGKGPADSTRDSGVNDDVERKFPGSKVQIGSEASGQGDNRTIPDDEGGNIDPATGRQTKAKDFEGVGGPEDKRRMEQEARPGDQEFDVNVRQGGSGNSAAAKLSKGER